MSTNVNVGTRNYEILLRTVFGEAAGESEIGQRAVCWVIYNRVKGNKSYWYDENEGNTIAGVCLKRGHFECWNEGEKRRQMVENMATDWGKRSLREIGNWLPHVYSQPKRNPIGECDHFNNPDKEEKRKKEEKRPDWMDNVDFVIQIGKHLFYRTKPELR